MTFRSKGLLFLGVLPVLGTLLRCVSDGDGDERPLILRHSVGLNVPEGVATVGVLACGAEPRFAVWIGPQARLRTCMHPCFNVSIPVNQHTPHKMQPETLRNAPAGCAWAARYSTKS